MVESLLRAPSRAHMNIGEIYFWTATINNWQRLLRSDSFKDLIVGTLDHLTRLNLIDVFGFVIMPNHMHLIWRILGLNGKESPQGSLLKFTAHQFLKRIRNDPQKLALYEVDRLNKKHEFWQREPLAVHLYSKKVAFQKLDYVHVNPVSKHWSLAKKPADYKYSSAKFYESGVKDFDFLKDLRKEF